MNRRDPMVKALPFVTLAVLLSGCMSNANREEPAPLSTPVEVPKKEPTPQEIGKRMAGPRDWYFETTYTGASEQEIVLKTPQTSAFKNVWPEWKKAIEFVTAEPLTESQIIALLFQLPKWEAFYRNGNFSEEDFRRYSGRLASMTPKNLDEFRDAVKRGSGDTESKHDALLLILQTKRLWKDDSLDASALRETSERLKALNREVVLDWVDVILEGQLSAARKRGEKIAVRGTLTVEALWLTAFDQLFVGGEFGKAFFHAALDEAREELGRRRAEARSQSGRK